MKIAGKMKARSKAVKTSHAKTSSHVFFTPKEEIS